jgi:hypothetical protein
MWMLIGGMILLSSCQLDERNRVKSMIRKIDEKDFARSLVLKWQEKEITKPSDMEYRILGRDTVCSELWNKSYKILIYLDSVGCTSCQFKQYQWRQLINESMTENLDVSFVFIVHSSDFEMLENDLIGRNFNYPIIYDRYNKFDELNDFPPTPYATFLLDKNNKVLLVGTPVDNAKMWALYKKAIIENHEYATQ